MPDSLKLSNLRKAVCAEKQSLDITRHDNAAIFAKMTAFQNGTGPAPSIDDFIDWRDSVKQVVFEKQIDSGMMDL